MGNAIFTMKKPKLKSQFLTPLKTQGIKGFDFFLLEDFSFYSNVIKDTIVVPKGFVCDGTSGFLKDDAKEPAVLHDYSYRSPDHKINVLRNGVLFPVYVAKSTGDRIFLEAMKVWKVPAWKRWARYLGVVIGGAESYRTGPSRFKIVSIP